MQWMYTSACRAIRLAPGLSYEGVPPDQNTYVDNSCQTFTSVAQQKLYVRPKRIVLYKS